MIDVREHRGYEAINALKQSGHTLDGTLLDLGCGLGHLAKVFSERNDYSIVGVDISFDRTKAAAEFVPRSDFVQCDGGALPFRDSVFKTIV